MEDSSMDGPSASQSGDVCLTTDRRRWGRFVSRIGRVAVTAGGVRQPAEILDESIGGAALLLPCVVQCDLGSEVVVEYDGVLLSGVVRNVLPQPSGQLRVGIQWVDGGSEQDVLQAGGAANSANVLTLFRAWQSGDCVTLGQSAEAIAREARSAGCDVLAHSAESLARQACRADGGAVVLRSCLEHLIGVLAQEGEPAAAD
jgi:hypothetical protein